MTFGRVPSEHEVVRLYNAGDLSAELARYHETAEGHDDEDAFIQRCTSLHNGGKIDLVSVVGQPAFAGVSGHPFFAVQHFYCEAIPKLVTTATALMGCCRILIERGGADFAAALPNGAFRAWCRSNPSEGAAVILNARAGDDLARRFVTFALHAAEDIDAAIDFVQSYTDDRRLSGMKALADMTYADTATARKATAVLEPLLAVGGDDQVRANALLAALEVLKKHKDAEIATRLIDAAVEEPGPSTLHGLAQIVLHPSLSGQALRTALRALETVSPENLGTVNILDMGLEQILRTSGEALALDFLTAKLADGKLTMKNFATTTHELTHRNLQRLYELIVRWFLSGSIALCNNVSELVGIDKKRAFDASVQQLGLTTEQQIFLCRKAIGFLFLKPVACCSIIVSVLRGGDKDAEVPLTELLFDPMLLSYGGDAREYLKGIPATDLAYVPIQNALAKDKEFYAGLDATGAIKELHPSDYQRDVAHQRAADDMRTVHKKAQSKSILLNLVRRSTILYGRRSLTYVTDPNGTQRAVSMDLKSFDVSFELPRREILDPVGLDYMLRMYRVEKLE